MPLTTDFFSALRRSIGDDHGPAFRDLEMVATKIWRETTGKQAKDGPIRQIPSAVYQYYLRLAHVALAGLPGVVAV